MARPNSGDHALRDHLLFLLKGGGAHATFEDTLNGWPLQFTGFKVAKFPHTAWMLLEHLRLAQRDIFGIQPEFDACFPEVAGRLLAGIGCAAE